MLAPLPAWPTPAARGGFHSRGRTSGLAPPIAAGLLCCVASSRSRPTRLRSSAARELADYARNVLLDGRLSSKLAPFRPGLPLQLLEEQRHLRSRGEEPEVEPLDIEWPEREPRIEMGRGGKRGKDMLPKTSVFLADASARATCLLRFAHHELAAVELFAWALLRFPEAPLGLRLALLQTLQEEQVHCQLYLDRVAEILPGAEETRPCGETPLTPYIWKSLMSVREAEHPLLAFLCGMGLTFEAANLDHSLHFRDLFLRAGDEASAAALQHVHDEEIRHVRLARVWLRRLSRSIPDSGHAQKDDADLYETFAAFPPFDLAKAKGRRLDAIDARRRAGFSEEYISKVQAAKHKKWPKQQCKV